MKLLEFREALDYFKSKYPLSAPFGLADTRKHCMESAIQVYKRLLLKNPQSSTLHFSTLALLAIDREGHFEKEKAKALIQLFRPDRDGNITMLDFLQSCDNVYKDVKMFTATVINSTQLDDAIEGMATALFFFILSLVILSIMGIKFQDIVSFWTSVILPFSFLFGTAVSKWLEVCKKSNVTLSIFTLHFPYPFRFFLFFRAPYLCFFENHMTLVTALLSLTLRKTLTQMDPPLGLLKSFQLP